MESAKPLSRKNARRRKYLARICEEATTAVLGRLNAEGFLGYWSAVAGGEAADSRDRGYADGLVGAEKVVFSRMLTEAPWERTRIANGSVMDVVSDLKASGEGDILVNSSASLIKSLRSADMIDRPYLLICLEIAGGGARLFEDGLPGTTWRVAHQETGERGKIALVYDRVR
ncbi:dihydrofolate reductase family protein [Ensifer sp. ENS06]|uniref:dihydrofolate reductase family protein n=1 Tax=Ensifer sp. ENS06 TaxID=2769276 RepID=UPI00177FF627|nr:dihydrofolate reductase family protein [Ensifer sp. ENS06]MBD9626047.1 dihydrofolate reductase family protein [Ensifer sp. ENS06]